MNDVFDLNHEEFSTTAKDSSEDLVSIEERFNDDRVKWKDKLVAISEKLKYVSNIAEIQIELYSSTGASRYFTPALGGRGKIW